MVHIWVSETHTEFLLPSTENRASTNSLKKIHIMIKKMKTSRIYTTEKAKNCNDNLK